MDHKTLALAIFALLGCQTGRDVFDNTPMVEIQTGGCFGYCPVIRLSVRNNGWVEYEGKQFAERQGLDSFQLSRAEINKLRVMVRRANLWQYPDRIESQVADAPWSTLTVFRSGSAKSVLGSMDRPERLLELENTLKNMAEEHGFQVKQGVNPKEPPLSTRRQILVTLRPDTNAGNWIQQFRNIRLLLIRRVSQENKWLVAYDPAEITESAVIELFLSTEGVVDALK